MKQKGDLTLVTVQDRSEIGEGEAKERFEVVKELEEEM